MVQKLYAGATTTMKASANDAMKGVHKNRCSEVNSRTTEYSGDESNRLFIL